MQLGFDLGAPERPQPSFESQTQFATALKSWQKGAGAKSGQLRAARVETPLGTMVAVADTAALMLLEFADRPELPREIRDLAAASGRIEAGSPRPIQETARQLDAYFARELETFDLPLAPKGTAFSNDVWASLRSIPYGQTTSYGALAQNLGRPTATRAVARANGANQIAIVIPCHRVIGADGTLTGYAGGLWRKQALLALESANKS